jgi:hypothetical protein
MELVDLKNVEKLSSGFFGYNLKIDTLNIPKVTQSSKKSHKHFTIIGAVKQNNVVGLNNLI